jgi:hypothetical protein
MFLSATKPISAFYTIAFLLFSHLTLCQTAKTAFITSDSLFKIEGRGLKVLIDPKVSGRVISFKLNGEELLAGADKDPFNYGSTFWQSPQKDWGWPPRPALDKNPYKATLEGNKVVLISATDSITGFQFIKNFQMNDLDSSIAASYFIRNNSKDVKQVAGWEIHRVSTGGLSFFPAGADAAAPQSTLQVKKMDDIVWYKSDPENLKETTNKLFMQAKQGWLAYTDGNLLFVKTFEDVPQEKVPAKEEEVEIYANTRRGYIELENQGPITSLKPGESLTYSVKWFLRKLPKYLKAEEGNKDLVQYVRKLVKVKQP